jgi:hypothetical protein
MASLRLVVSLLNVGRDATGTPLVRDKGIPVGITSGAIMPTDRNARLASCEFSTARGSQSNVSAPVAKALCRFP